MKRLLQAPNLVMATLWADQLSGAGFASRVQRAYTSGIAGEMPPDQCLPEVWVDDDRDHAPALALMSEWQNAPEQRWHCTTCDEIIEGPFEQCWNCGAWRPDAH